MSFQSTFKKSYILFAINSFISLCAISSPLFCADLTLEEKVGQILMVHFPGECANEEARILVEDLKVGGIIYYTWANGLSSKKQVTELSSSLQKMATIPLLIATDQEGGRIVRLQNGFTIFPSSFELASSGDPKVVEEACFTTGREMLEAGVNMNLAPVVDVNVNPKNPVIGNRSFGDDPATVSKFGGAALKGYNRAGVIATLKHFPGHGDVGIDSHTALPIVTKNLKALEAIELFPFRELCPAASAIMTAHILMPALDPDHPATVSKKTLSYLREVIGFQGVIITDSLIMNALLDRYESIDEAAIAALNAGSDILLLGGKLLNGSHAGLELTTPDIKRIHSSILAAVKSGRVSEERLSDAVARVLKLKGV
jgi:beta-N-acetylhexosaminidase